MKPKLEDSVEKFQGCHRDLSTHIQCLFYNFVVTLLRPKFFSFLILGIRLPIYRFDKKSLGPVPHAEQEMYTFPETSFAFFPCVGFVLFPFGSSTDFGFYCYPFIQNSHTGNNSNWIDRSNIPAERYNVDVHRWYRL